ncbi:MobH family relaxase [Stenotrophomonas pavanii]|uniref:MobH family relaxase n=1 Tax=Stenotrophomonas pavanii TaxID=487698 RepID=UPI002DB9E182|nr:MobH family relaxase [Stenotrophomonas pavanii]MEC4339738.1 MobH family relaxase [Stenotrophomonas pavanii]
MLKRLASLFKSDTASVVAPLTPAPGTVTQTIDPGAPYVDGEPVPRWPELGAALVAATPQDLLETQMENIRKIRSFSPLRPAEFDSLLMPVFLRYASWVHLLPASETHHHFGPGGLLAHGFEVALHAARMADGKQVGVDLSPSERSKMQPRWKTATMLAGLFHDLGKPLVDCGATDPGRNIRWPAHSCSLYDWLVAHNLTHYRIYWQAGPRHERHKPVGTAITREILGKPLLEYLSDEPTQDVMNSLMMSIAVGRSSTNLMSNLVAEADSLSVAADLKRLATRTQGSGMGGQQSIGALIMGELRRMIETNQLKFNKKGELLWWTEEGAFGNYPQVLDAVKPALAKRQVNGIPPNTLDIAQLLSDTGFIESCDDGAEGREPKQHSNMWMLTTKLPAKDGSLEILPPLRVLRFATPDNLFGNMPRPAVVEGSAVPPFVTAEQRAEIAAQVAIVDEPQSADSALGKAEAPPPVNAIEGGATGPAQGGHDAMADGPVEGEVSESDGPVISDRRNRRDIAAERSVENQLRQQRKEADKGGARELLKVLERDFAGAAVAEILRRIAGGRIKWNESAFETHDGLVLRYPESFGRTGMSEADLLQHCATNKWLVIDSGSDRKVTEREFPTGTRHKCVILTQQVLRAWQAICSEHPEVQSGGTVDLYGESDVIQPKEEPVPRQPVGQESARQHASQGGPQHGHQAGGDPDRGRPSSGRSQQPRDAGQNGQNGRNGQNSQNAPNGQNGQGGRGGQGGRSSQSGQNGHGGNAPGGRQGQQPRQGAQTQPAAHSSQGRQGAGAEPNHGRQGQSAPPPATPARVPAGGAPDKPARVASTPDFDGAGPIQQPTRNGKPLPPVADAIIGGRPRPAPRPPENQDPSRYGAISDGKTPSAELKTGPGGKEDLRTHTLAALTPQKIRWINGMALGVVEAGRLLSGEDSTIENPMLLRDALKRIALANEIRPAPFIAALTTQDNPAFLLKDPGTANIDDVTDLKVNPDYVQPQWLIDRLVAYKQKLAEKRARGETA